MFITETLKKYFSLFFKSLFFLSLIILISHFGDFLTLSNTDKLPFLKSIFTLILNLSVALIPMILILVSGLFFAFPYSINRSLLLKVIPVIVILNTLFLSLYLFYPNTPSENPPKIEQRIQPILENNKIYQFGQANLYVHQTNTSTGILIMSKVFFIDQIQNINRSIELKSSRNDRNNTFFHQKIQIQIPVHLKTIAISTPKMGRIIPDFFSQDLIRTKNIFRQIFPSSNPAISILSIFLFSMGFFTLIITISLFFKDRKIYVLHLSLLFLLMVGEYLVLSPAVQLIGLINFGIKSHTVALLIPAVLMTFLGILISFVIIQFKVPKPIRPNTINDGGFNAPTV